MMMRAARVELSPSQPWLPGKVVDRPACPSRSRREAIMRGADSDVELMRKATNVIVARLSGCSWHGDQQAKARTVSTIDPSTSRYGIR